MTAQTTGAGWSAQQGALATAAEHVTTARGDITALAQSLGAQIDVLGARWGGEGAGAFRRVHSAWQEKQRRILGALDVLAESLVVTDRENVATDAAQAETTARFLSRMG